MAYTSGGITGTTPPKFQVAGVNVFLNFARVTRYEPDFKDVLNESSLNRARGFIGKNHHWVVEIAINLHKHPDPINKIGEILTHLHAANCQVWRHREGLPFRDSTGTNVDFFFADYTTTHLRTTDFKDLLTIVFRSVDVVDFTQSLGSGGTFARALSATLANAAYEDANTKLLKAIPDVANSGIRRVAGRFGGTGILIEGTDQNLLDTDIDNWTAAGVTIDDNTTEQPDPFDTFNAFRITHTSGQSITFTTGVAVSAVDAILSVYMKPRDRLGSDLTMFLVGSTAGGAPSFPVQVRMNSAASKKLNGFQRYELDFDQSVDPAMTGNWEVTLQWTASGGTYVFAPNLILSRRHPNGVILGGSNISRLAESLKLITRDLPIKEGQGTIFLHFKPNWALGTTSNAHYLFQVGDPNFNATIQIVFQAGNNTLQVSMISNSGAASTSLVDMTGEVTKGAWSSFGFVWDVEATLGTSGTQTGLSYVNGVFNLGLGLSPGRPLKSLNTALSLTEIGSDESTNQFDGVIDQVFISDRIMPASFFAKYDKQPLPAKLTF